LLTRSHASMVTTLVKDSQLWDGRGLIELKSYLFGGSTWNIHK